MVSTSEVQELSSYIDGGSPNKTSVKSTDSSFSIVDHEKKPISCDYYPSLNTALDGDSSDGDIYEKRADIKEVC